MGRTKVLVEWRDDGRLFAGNIEVLFDWCYHILAEMEGRTGYPPPPPPSVTWETLELLGLSSRCTHQHTCPVCGRTFLGAPSARYCSGECRKPAQRAAAAKQQAGRVEYRRRSIEDEDVSCPICGKPLADRRRVHWDRPNYCSGACRQKAYRLRSEPTASDGT